MARTIGGKRPQPTGIAVGRPILDPEYERGVNLRYRGALFSEPFQAQAEAVAEPSAHPARDGQGADTPDANVPDLDEIDAGHSLLPVRVAALVRTPGARRAARGIAVMLLLVVVIALADDIVRRPAVIAGVPIAAQQPPGSLSPFERVAALAEQARLSGNIRQASAPGACAPVPPGYAPERAILSVIRRFVPGTTETDAARTLDQFTGLCSLQLRTNAPGHVRLVVTISAPPARPAPNTLDAIEVGLENRGNDTVEYVLETAHTGWEILIGAVGAVADLPRTTDLAMAAGSAQMQW